MTRAGASPSQNGFTLAEMLVSLALLSVLTLMLVDSLGARTLAWGRIDRATSASEAVEAAQALIYDRIQRISPVTIYDISPPGPDFNGHTNSLIFLAPPRQADGVGALRRYQLSLDAAGELVLDSASDLAIDPDRLTNRQVLLRGVESLDLAYYGAAKLAHGPAWRPDWLEQPAMPQLVRVRLSFQPGDGRRWPDLIVRPLADIDTGCHLNIETNGCRGR